MVAEVVTGEAEITEEITDPIARFPAQFRPEIRRAQEGIVAGADALDPTTAIAHARALRSALYRAEHYQPSSGW